MSDAVEVLRRIAEQVGDAPEGLAVTVAARERDAYAVVIATILSLRTRDEVTQVATPRLLDRAPTPSEMLKLSEGEIASIIYPTSFHRTKSRHIRALSRQIVEEFGGRVPDTMDGLLKLTGVGRKSANLIYNLAFGKPGICVDAHVHRITNRLGFVSTSGPEETERQLERVLPEEWWIPVNGVLIAFGRKQCTPVSPRCTSCPVAEDCPRVGVGKSR